MGNEAQKMLALTNRQARAERHAARMRRIKANKRRAAEGRRVMMEAQRLYVPGDLAQRIIELCDEVPSYGTTAMINRLAENLLGVLARCPRNIQQDICGQVVYAATVTSIAAKRETLKRLLERISRACGIPCPVVEI